MKRLHFLTFFTIALLYINTSTAHNRIVDSIKHLIENRSADDTIKGQLYIQLANQYINTSSDTLSILGNKALTIAEKEDNKTLEAMSLELIGIANFYKGNYDDARTYYYKSLAICKETGLTKTEGSLYNKLGSVCLRQAQLSKALSFYDSSLSIAEKNNYIDMLGRARSNIASVYYKVGNYTRALRYYLEGLKDHEKRNDKTDIETSLLNISNVHFRLNDYPQALEYARKAMVYTKESGSIGGMISNLSLHALIYDKASKYDSSLLKLNEALLLAREINNDFYVNLLNGNIAECYLNMGKYVPSKRLYTTVIAESKRIGDYEGEATAKAGLGEVYFKQKQYKKGEECMLAALSMMQATSQKERVVDIAEHLSSAYEAIGDQKNALKFIKIKKVYTDSIAAASASQEAERLHYQYELEKKDNEIALLAKETELEKEKLKQSRLMLIAAIVGLALALVAIYYFVTNLTNIKRSNTLIRDQKDEIFKQKKKLEELNRFKDTMFSVLSHDLRSPVNALTGTLSLLDEGIITPEEFVAFKPELNNKLQSVTLMLDNLLHWAQMQMKGENDIERKPIDLYNITNVVADTLDDASNQKNLSLDNHISEGTLAFGDPNQIEMVMRNIMSNAVKFTPDNGTVTLKATKDDTYTKIYISDNGIGMPASKAANLFNEEPVDSTLGTSGEKGTGIGMKLSHAFIKKHGGDITVNSEEGKGTTFTILLPNAN